MESTGSFEYSRKVIRELKVKATELIKDMDGGSGKGEGVRKILERMDVEQ